jgi:serine/threonine-protein kinase
VIIQKIDGIAFEMREAHDFSFLRDYGRVFRVFSRNDSGNISFGVEDGADRYFVKVAGARTAEYDGIPEEAIATLKAAVPLYQALAHPSLIELTDHFVRGDVYAAVFKWADGDCLFDYWNFDYYSENPGIIPPRERFRALPAEKKLKAFDVMFEFLTHVEAKGYVAVDFNDNNIMYDFDREILTMCDIDFYKKRPLINEIGEGFWGTKRMKAPEEYIPSAEIDGVTTVFTMGAMLMHFFGGYTREEIGGMYANNAFSPCRRETWELSDSMYQAAMKAVSPNRADRYPSMEAFWEDWKCRERF